MERSASRDFLFLAALALLLLWSAFDYGGRYLHVQVFSQVLAAGLLLLFSVRTYRLGYLSSLLGYPLLKPALLWLLALSITWIFSVNQLASLEELLRILMYLVVAFSVYGWFSSSADPQKEVLRLMAMAVATGCGVSLAGLWHWRLGESLSSTFSRTNDLAGYLLLLVPLSLHLFFTARTVWGRVLYGLAVTILSGSLILTNSRSSWLAGLVGILVVFWINRDRFKEPFYRWTIVLITLGFVGTVVLNAGHILPRLETLLSLEIFRENAAHWRMALLRSAWHMFLAKPLVGFGLNTYGTALPAYQEQVGYYSINPHNYYLQALAETGLIGFSAFMFWLVSVYKSVWKQPNIASGGVLAGLTASFLHIGVDIDWSVSAIPLLCAILLGGGLVSAQKQVLHGESEPVPRIAVGLMTFVALILLCLPVSNYFSAMAYQRGVAFLDKQQTAEAHKSLERAIALAPWPSSAHYYSLATFYQRENELQKSLEAAQRAIRLDQYKSQNYSLSADLFLALEQSTEAEAMLLLRAKLNPYRHPEIYSDLGDFYLRYQKDASKALSWYQSGAEAFRPEALKHYELYTPGDRYELFNLYQKQALVLEQLNRQPEANTLRQKSQDLIQHGMRDLYIRAGYGNPVAAVRSYWQELDEHHRNPEHQFTALHPEAQIVAPPPGRLDPERLRFEYVERGYFDARLIYSVPVLSVADSEKRWVIIEDRLRGAENGWKIVQRRVLNP